MVRKKRQRFPRHPSASQNCLELPTTSHVLVWDFKPHSLSSGEARPTCRENPCILGSTNSCPTAVHIKPCSALVFKDPILVFATTTKICIRGCFTQACATNFITNPHAPLDIDAAQPQHWLDVSHLFKRHPFSGLVHSAGELLHTLQRISTSMTTALLFK